MCFGSLVILNSDNIFTPLSFSLMIISPGGSHEAAGDDRGIVFLYYHVNVTICRLLLLTAQLCQVLHNP